MVSPPSVPDHYPVSLHTTSFVRGMSQVIPCPARRDFEMSSPCFLGGIKLSKTSCLKTGPQLVGPFEQELGSGLHGCRLAPHTLVGHDQPAILLLIANYSTMVTYIPSVAITWEELREMRKGKLGRSGPSSHSIPYMAIDSPHDQNLSPSLLSESWQACYICTSARPYGALAGQINISHDGACHVPSRQAL